MSDHRPSAADARFVDSVPEMYDRHLGPLLFDQYARDLATRLTASGRPIRRVLEMRRLVNEALDPMRFRLLRQS